MLFLSNTGWLAADMGNRLSKIYTRTGDDGSTGLGDGTRVDKDSLRVEAMGTVDELNCSIGTLLCHSLPEETRSELINIQHSLFDIGGEICIPGSTVITPDRVDKLEHLLDTLNQQLTPLKEFILPGGTLHSSTPWTNEEALRSIALPPRPAPAQLSPHQLTQHTPTPTPPHFTPS